jgi:translation initiation factor 2 alpha subunit (eIF-2alpha)
MNFEVSDLVLCTVERIEGTIVFVKIEDNGEETEGSIVTSEIAPGRIRNLREYVVPKKKIICKVLRISPSGNVELSLRRVTPKERKDTLEYYSQEKTYIGIIKNILGEKTSDKVAEIRKENSLFDFFSEAKENPKKLEKLFGKKDSEKILEILKSEKQRIYFVKKEILVKSNKSDGLESIKSILGDVRDAEIKYLAPGRYSLKTSAEDVKKADSKAREIISEIEKNSKKAGLDFSVKEK